MPSVLYHTPVMLSESIDALAVSPAGTYVDATFGGGGHSREVLRRLGPTGRLVAFDRDADAIAMAPADERLTLVRGDFRYLRNFLRYEGVEAVDGLLADLGVSSHHFDTPARGFSFRFDAPLDMRMNQEGGRTAADIVNSYDEQRLADVLRLYGEIRPARALAQAIVSQRARTPITTTGALVDVARSLPAMREGTKPLARLFQALRIEVNGEMEALAALLRQAVEMLRPGGRLVVITYHSLEDRMVKNVMKSGSPDGRVEKDFFGNVHAPLRAIGRARVPSPAEQADNPRSRSAKLRVAEKLQAAPSGSPDRGEMALTGIHRTTYSASAAPSGFSDRGRDGAEER